MGECSENNTAVLAAGPFNSGLMARDWPAGDATFDYGPADPEVVDRARAMAEWCWRHGVSLPSAALHFPLRHPSVSHVVAGFRSPGEVRAALANLEILVVDELFHEIEGL